MDPSEALEKAVRELNEAIDALAKAAKDLDVSQKTIQSVKNVLREQKAELERLIKKLNDEETSAEEKPAIRRRINELERSIEDLREKIPDLETEVEVQKKLLKFAKEDLTKGLEKFNKALADFVRQ